MCLAADVAAYVKVWDDGIVSASDHCNVQNIEPTSHLSVRNRCELCSFTVYFLYVLGNVHFCCIFLPFQTLCNVQYVCIFSTISPFRARALTSTPHTIICICAIVPTEGTTKKNLNISFMTYGKCVFVCLLLKLKSSGQHRSLCRVIVMCGSRAHILQQAAPPRRQCIVSKNHLISSFHGEVSLAARLSCANTRIYQSDRA